MKIDTKMLIYYIAIAIAIGLLIYTTIKGI